MRTTEAVMKGDEPSAKSEVTNSLQLELNSVFRKMQNRHRPCVDIGNLNHVKSGRSVTYSAGCRSGSATNGITGLQQDVIKDAVASGHDSKSSLCDVSKIDRSTGSHMPSTEDVVTPDHTRVSGYNDLGGIHVVEYLHKPDACLPSLSAKRNDGRDRIQEFCTAPVACFERCHSLHENMSTDRNNSGKGGTEIESKLDETGNELDVNLNGNSENMRRKHEENLKEGWRGCTPQSMCNQGMWEEHGTMEQSLKHRLTALSPVQRPPGSSCVLGHFGSTPQIGRFSPVQGSSRSLRAMNPSGSPREGSAGYLQDLIPCGCSQVKQLVRSSSSPLSTGLPQTRGKYVFSKRLGSSGYSPTQRYSASKQIQRSSGSKQTVGSSGPKQLQGSSGSTQNQGSSGSKQMQGSSGSKQIQGSSVSKQKQGSSEFKQMQGSSGSKEIHGSSGSKNIHGSSGSKEIQGSSGSKNIHGSSGSKQIQRSSGSIPKQVSSGPKQKQGSSGSKQIQGSSVSKQTERPNGSAQVLGPCGQSSKFDQMDVLHEEVCSLSLSESLDFENKVARICENMIRSDISSATHNSQQSNSSDCDQSHTRTISADDSSAGDGYIYLWDGVTHLPPGHPDKLLPFPVGSSTCGTAENEVCDPPSGCTSRNGGHLFDAVAYIKSNLAHNSSVKSDWAHFVENENKMLECVRCASRVTRSTSLATGTARSDELLRSTGRVRKSSSETLKKSEHIGDVFRSDSVCTSRKDVQRSTESRSRNRSVRSRSEQISRNRSMGNILEPQLRKTHSHNERTAVLCHKNHSEKRCPTNESSEERGRRGRKLLFPSACRGAECVGVPRQGRASSVHRITSSSSYRRYRNPLRHHGRSASFATICHNIGTTGPRSKHRRHRKDAGKYKSKTSIGCNNGTDIPDASAATYVNTAAFCDFADFEDSLIRYVHVNDLSLLNDDIRQRYRLHLDGTPGVATMAPPGACRLRRFRCCFCCHQTTSALEPAAIGSSKRISSNFRATFWLVNVTFLQSPHFFHY